MNTHVETMVPAIRRHSVGTTLLSGGREGKERTHEKDEQAAQSTEDDERDYVAERRSYRRGDVICSHITLQRK